VVKQPHRWLAIAKGGTELHSVEQMVEQMAHKLSVKPKALGHLRLHYWHLWSALKEAEANPLVPEGWRKAPEGSIGWRKYKQFCEALKLLDGDPHR
jgi:hypothetical protein